VVGSSLACEVSRETHDWNSQVSQGIFLDPIVASS